MRKGVSKENNLKLSPENSLSLGQKLFAYVGVAPEMHLGKKYNINLYKIEIIREK